MTTRQAATLVPGPLEAYAQAFDPLVEQGRRRDAVRRHLERLLPPAERNRMLTALANAELVVAVQYGAVQSLQ